ncbi:MAG TPA: hypothetical protein VFQ88_14085 [Nevskiaceae bacterium]|nr:hypothetical protein [Nevskiaceae bacterium]
MMRMLLHCLAYGVAYHYAEMHGLHSPWMYGMGAVAVVHMLGALTFRRRWYGRHRWI